VYKLIRFKMIMCLLFMMVVGLNFHNLTFKRNLKERRLTMFAIFLTQTYEKKTVVTMYVFVLSVCKI
jgi:hypothetical protein